MTNEQIIKRLQKRIEKARKNPKLSENDYILLSVKELMAVKEMCEPCEPIDYNSLK